MAGFGKRGTWKAKGMKCLDLARKAKKRGKTAEVRQRVSDAKYCFRKSREIQKRYR